MKKQQSGFSLIEVLVATVIMAIGILGIAGLQVVSLQQNRSSLLRSEALQIGNDIIDRMRANPELAYAPVDYTDAPTSGAKNCIGTAANCSTAEMKEYDITLWKCMINPNDSTREPTRWPWWSFTDLKWSRSRKSTDSSSLERPARLISRPRAESR